MSFSDEQKTEVRGLCPRDGTGQPRLRVLIETAVPPGRDVLRASRACAAMPRVASESPRFHCIFRLGPATCAPHPAEEAAAVAQW